MNFPPRVDQPRGSVHLAAATAPLHAPARDCGSCDKAGETSGLWDGHDRSIVMLNHDTPIPGTVIDPGTIFLRSKNSKALLSHYTAEWSEAGEPELMQRHREKPKSQWTAGDYRLLVGVSKSVFLRILTGDKFGGVVSVNNLRGGEVVSVGADKSNQGAVYVMDVNGDVKSSLTVR